jgi:hypothetical protein
MRNFTAHDSDYIHMWALAHHPASQRTFDTPAPAPQPSAAPQRAWRVALRVVHDVEGPTMRATLTAGGEGRREESKRDDDVTPAVLIPMNDGDCYHMVDDFNHHHQHAVIQPEPTAATDTSATEAAEAASALEVPPPIASRSRMGTASAPCANAASPPSRRQVYLSA